MLNQILQFSIISCDLPPHFCLHCYEILVECSIRTRLLDSIMILWYPSCHVGILIQKVQYVFAHHKQITICCDNNVLIINILIVNSKKSMKNLIFFNNWRNKI